MGVEFWRGRGSVSFAKDEVITVKDGRGRTVERITCLKVIPKQADEAGDYTAYKMDVRHV